MLPPAYGRTLVAWHFAWPNQFLGFLLFVQFADFLKVFLAINVEYEVFLTSNDFI